MIGTSTNTVQFDTSSSITTVTATGNGGLLYLSGSTQNIAFSYVTVTSVSTSAEGAIIYSAISTNTMSLNM